MGTITELSPQKKRKDRFNLYLDGEFLCGINLESIVKHHLRVGAEADGESLRRAVFESECSDAFQRGADYIARGRRTEAELLGYLAGRGFDAEAAQFAFEKLKSYHYVDDAAWLESYFAYHTEGKGVFKIRQELRAKGIPDDMAEERLSRFTESTEDAVALARKFLRGREPDAKARAALWRHLAGKGYGRDTIAEAVRAAFGGELSEDPL